MFCCPFVFGWVDKVWMRSVFNNNTLNNIPILLHIYRHNLQHILVGFNHKQNVCFTTLKCPRLSPSSPTHRNPTLGYQRTLEERTYATITTLVVHLHTPYTTSPGWSVLCVCCQWFGQPVRAMELSVLMYSNCVCVCVCVFVWMSVCVCLCVAWQRPHGRADMWLGGWSPLSATGAFLPHGAASSWG